MILTTTKKIIFMPPFVHRIHFMLEDFYNFVVCAVPYLPITLSVTSQRLTGPQLRLGQQCVEEYTLAPSRRRLIQFWPMKRKPDLLDVFEKAFPFFLSALRRNMSN